jgi:hypothetical protein
MAIFRQFIEERWSNLGTNRLDLFESDEGSNAEDGKNDSRCDS